MFPNKLKKTFLSSKPCSLYVSQHYSTMINVLSLRRTCARNVYDPYTLGINNKNFYSFIWKSMKKKLIGHLLWYAITFISEVIRNNINCWLSIRCDVTSWVSMYFEYITEHCSVIITSNFMKFCMQILNEETHWKSILIMLPKQLCPSQAPFTQFL